MKGDSVFIHVPTEDILSSEEAAKAIKAIAETIIAKLAKKSTPWKLYLGFNKKKLMVFEKVRTYFGLLGCPNYKNLADIKMNVLKQDCDNAANISRNALTQH